MRKAAITAIVLSLASATLLSAQEKDKEKARLTGLVIDATSRAPVSSAVAHIDGIERATATDSSGRFVLEKLPRGALWLEVARLGYATELLDLRLTGEDSLIVELKPHTDVLPALPAVMEQLHSRRRRSHAVVRVFDVARLATSTTNLRQLLSSYGPIGTCAGRNGFPPDENCAVTAGGFRLLRVYIDEMPVFAAPLDQYEPYEFELAEYFTGPSMVRLYTAAFLERVARRKTFISPAL